jgi:hypothetical protein
MEFQQYVTIVKRRLWLIILMMLLPEVAGAAGVYVEPPIEVQALASAIRNGLDSDHLRWVARRHIERNFSLKRRREKLYRYIQEAYDAKQKVGEQAKVG